MIRANNDEVDEYPTSHPKEDEILKKKALRLGWAIPIEKKREIVNRVTEIAVDPDSSNRDAVSAARCLTSMNGQDVALTISGIADKEEAEKLKPVSTVDMLVAMRRSTAPGNVD